MPSWKKVITSGSAAALGSLNVTGGITGSSIIITGSAGTLFSSNVDTLILTGSMIVTGSSVITGSLNVSQGITGSLFGTSSWAVSASWAPTPDTAASASFVTASNVYGPYGSNSIISASYAVSSSRAVSASYALTASYSKNLQISGSIANVDYIDFNTGSATPAYKSGRVYWDNTDGALAVYNAEADITLQVGQESWVRVFNEGTTITNGTAVRLIGSHGDVPLIVRAQSQQVSGSALGDNQIIGIATHTIETNSIGYVTTQGLVRGLNTNTFADGDLLFASSSAGVLTNVIPQAPFEVIQVGICVKAGPGASGIVFVFPTQPIDFGDLASAERGVYQYGDIWSYIQSGSSGVWRHGRSLSGSYGITGSLNVTQGITGSLFGTASYAISASYVNGSIFTNSNSAASASYAATASNIQGGTANYIPIWNTETSLSNSAIYQSAGNVGIETTTPGEKLEVNGNALIKTAFIGTVLAFGDNYTSFSHISRAGSDNYSLLSDNTGITYLNASAGKDIRFRINNIDKAILDSSGNFGIATLTPNAPLDVNGNAIVTGSLIVTAGITGSLFGTSSWAVSASWAPGGATFPFTGNATISGSLGITGSLQVSSSIFQYSNNAAITSGSTANIASFPTSSYMAGFFDFVASSNGNARAGTVFTVWNGASLEYVETSTNDIGSTTNLILSASLSAGAVRLQGTSLSGSWNVKTLTRMI